MSYPLKKFSTVKDIPEEKKEEVLTSALGLIRQIQFYGRINHDRPKDYKELCDTFAKENNIEL